MRPATVVTVCVLVLGGAAAAGAQQSLAEPARPIGSGNDEPSGVVIDNSSLVRAGSAAGPGPAAGAGPLLDAMRQCAAAMRELNSILDETGSGKVFYDPEWRERIDNAAFEFARARGDLTLVPISDRYLASWDAADDALGEAVGALSVVQDAIADDQPVFARAKKQLLTSEQRVNRAYAEMRAVHRAEIAEQPAPPIDPIAASRAIDELCGRRFGTGSEGFDSCVSEQRSAIDHILARNAAPPGLSTAAFNTIRNDCRFEWPGDYVNRDRCEQRRMAAGEGG